MGRGFSYDPSAPDKKRVRLEILLANKKKFINKGPVNMWITFYMKRPKSHYRTGKFSNMLKKDAPLYHITKPDVDNLLKFVMDVCCVLYKDDCQVHFVNASKVYCDKYTDGDPRTEIDIVLNKGE